MAPEVDLDADDSDDEEMTDSGKEDDIYEEGGREGLIDDDEIEAWEEGFMAGAEGDGQSAKCRKCGKILMGPDDIVELKIKTRTLRFCSEICADSYKEEMEEQLE